MDVRRVSTTNIRPASYIIQQASDTHKRIDLNPMDLLFLNIAYMQKGFLFTKQHEEGKSIKDKISHLKTSLSHTLDHFFPLAGRLGIEKHEDDGNTISIYINCNSEGAEFVHATADVSVEDIVSPTYVPQAVIDRMFLLTGVRNCQGQSHPLLSIQVTELIDGVFIGCSANHSVCDGTSFWKFINAWSEITSSSGNHTYSHPSPVFERWFINETDCPIRLHLSSVHDKLSAKKNITGTDEVPSLDLVEKCFHFTKSNIAALKERANLEIVSGTKQNMVISSLQAILAFVWTAVVRSRSCLNDNWDESRELELRLLMNNRTKLVPPLLETYFGNSIARGVVTVKEGQLVKGSGFGFLASVLNGVVNSNNFKKSRNFIESWIEKPLMPVPGGNTGIVGNVFVARSSQWFNMYGNNFGWGRPIAVRTGANGKSYGITTVNPGPVEESVAIEICLPIEVFKAMENDAEFMEAFSS
ncbi:protein ENHANCED PSEUDOMONAS SUSCEPTIBILTY 1-like [Papaver somniferum]|nr:protein ENHANCED PSEUDOMONAS SUSCEPTIBILTY 1-like [Papaver somniferum]